MMTALTIDAKTTKETAADRYARNIARGTTKIATGVDPHNLLMKKKDKKPTMTTPFATTPSATLPKKKNRVDQLLEQYDARNTMINAGLKDLGEATKDGMAASINHMRGKDEKAAKNAVKAAVKIGKAVKRAKEYHDKYE